ncbi:FACT complex subunit [Nymphaea thermarum]|nr:FACT complex subunit [Nymphaea thermarum]
MSSEAKHASSSLRLAKGGGGGCQGHGNLRLQASKARPARPSCPPCSELTAATSPSRLCGLNLVFGDGNLPKPPTLILHDEVLVLNLKIEYVEFERHGAGGAAGAKVPAGPTLAPPLPSSQQHKNAEMPSLGRA